MKGLSDKGLIKSLYSINNMENLKTPLGNINNISSPQTTTYKPSENLGEKPSRIRRLGRWIKNNSGKILTVVGISATIGVVEEGWLHRLYNVALHVGDVRYAEYSPVWPGKGYSLHKTIEILGQRIIIPWGTMGGPRSGLLLMNHVDPIDLSIYDALMKTPANVYLIGLGAAVSIGVLGYGFCRLGRKIDNWYKGRK